jgi:hypothetical protein
MAGLVPAIHVFNADRQFKTWMPGTRPGMTARYYFFLIVKVSTPPVQPTDA